MNKHNNDMLNRKKALELFKEEMAKEIGLDITTEKNNTTKKIVDQTEKNYTNLGRS